VAALKARLKDFERSETLLKDKLKEEHAQLLNFQKKLSQAGNHLKSLAQENSNLTKSLAQQKTDLDAVRDEQVAALQEEIAKTKEEHQQEIKRLVSILQSIDDSEEVPDVSSSALLDNYIKSVQKKLNASATVGKKDEDLEQKIQELQQEIQGTLCIALFYYMNQDAE
jgi:chromosome segregation ATPase